MTMRPSTASPPRRPGTQVVCGILGVALCLAAFAVWFQWRQTRRCLHFYGPTVARSIQSAPRVELWDLAAGGDPERPVPLRRVDVSTARGLVHLRRGLVEDANFGWGEAADGIRSWDVALAFYLDAAAAEPNAVLILDLDTVGGALAVPGRPGVVGLGRLRTGLAAWLEATRAAAAD